MTDRKDKGGELVMSYKCPIHNKVLRTVEDYPGALVHNGCLELFAVIDGHLCISKGKVWIDTETKEERIPPEYKPVRF